MSPYGQDVFLVGLDSMNERMLGGEYGTKGLARYVSYTYSVGQLLNRHRFESHIFDLEFINFTQQSSGVWDVEKNM